MKIARNITINLTENEVKKIIACHIRNELECNSITAEDVEFRISDRCVGYGPMERYEHYFEKATVKCILADTKAGET